MPDDKPKPPKVYGSPIGYTPPDPTRKQKAATPASDQQLAAEYQKWMNKAIVTAHQQFKQQMAAKQQGTAKAAARPRGSSVAGPKKERQPPAILNQQIEEQSK